MQCHCETLNPRKETRTPIPWKLQ
uniref:Uncharacterized protein n=1 Tax=Anguilla anguilla TaxID=7936 RepID=A0A0E9VC54_ANGAN